MEKLEQDVISALTINYLNVFVIDLEQDLCHFFKLDGFVYAGLNKDSKNVKYTDMIATYARTRTAPEDKDRLYNLLCCENLKKLFSDPTRKQFEISYSAVFDGAPHYFTGNIVRIASSDHRTLLAAGFQNIDALIARQKVIADEAMVKSYQALSSIYLCMYRFDVLNGSYSMIKTAPMIRNLRITKAHTSFGDQLNHVMGILSTESHLKEVLKFVDLSTLSLRMKQRSTIAQEFLSATSGWCRMRFIKEDENDQGQLCHAIFAVEVINEEKQRELFLRHLSETDPLTGINNRGCGVHKVIGLMHDGIEGMLCIIDCDDFKEINDNYGHSVGDDVIVAIARRLQGVCRKSDVVMRLGGDEFAIFTPDITNTDQAHILWERILFSLGTLEIPELDGKKVTISLGGVFYKGSETSVSFDDLYRQADAAMYRSKARGGNCCTFFD